MKSYPFYNKKALSFVFMQMSRIIHYITAATQISIQLTFGPSGPWPPAIPFSPWSPDAPGSPLSPGLPRSPYKMEIITYSEVRVQFW